MVRFRALRSWRAKFKGREYQRTVKKARRAHQRSLRILPLAGGDPNEA